jgi:hypothetical protein
MSPSRPRLLRENAFLAAAVWLQLHATGEPRR